MGAISTSAEAADSRRSIPCYVFFRNRQGRWQANASGGSLFEAAYRALCWFRDWRGPHPDPDTILEVDAGWAHQQKTYCVRVSRVLAQYGETHAAFFSRRRSGT